MVRVTLTGADLAGFPHLSPDDHVKLFFPPPGQDEPLMPEVTDEGMRPVEPGRPRPVFRDYTVRHLREQDGELDIDFALHGHGPGAQWAMSARPGHRIGVIGPRGSVVVPAGFDWYLLGADETALPALGGWLERIPAGVAVHAVVEVENPDEQIDLDCAGNLTLDWVHRQTGGTLAAGVARFVPPGGAGYVWIAGEAGALRPIRQHVRTFENAHVDVDGYWRRGVVNHDHHDTDGD